MEPHIANLLREWHSLTTTLSDVGDEETARISVFCQVAVRYFHHLGGLRNVSVDLKYDVQ